MQAAANHRVLSDATAKARGGTCPALVGEIRAAARDLARSVPRRAVTLARKRGGDAAFEAGEFSLAVEAGRSEVRLSARREGAGVCVVMVPWRGEWDGYLHQASGMPEHEIPGFIRSLADEAPNVRWIREAPEATASGPRF